MGDNGIGEAGFGAVILYGKTQRKDSPVSRVGKMKSLAEAIAKASSPNQLGRSSGIELVAGDAIAQVKAGEFEVRSEAVDWGYWPWRWPQPDSSFYLPGLRGCPF